MEQEENSKALGPKDTLLQYNMPDLITKRVPKQDIPVNSPADVPLAGAHQSEYVVPPVSKTASTEEILDIIFPPRQWEDKGQLWRQTVSPDPVTAEYIAQLSERLDKCLEGQNAKEDGIDAVRSKLFRQFFDEIIRIETVICGERGLLLARIRDDHKYTISVYRKLYESCMSYAMRKTLQAEKNDRDEALYLEEVKEINVELQKEIANVKEKIEIFQKEMQEQRDAEMKNHAGTLVFLQGINQQMKAQLKTLLKPKRQK